MKRKLCLLLSVLMIIGMLAGCGSSNEPAATDTSAADTGVVVADPDYPSNGTINAVIGWSAGGSTDLNAREIASLMSVRLGCNNNCVNVTGGSGSIAAAQVMEEGQDGETVWGGMISAMNTWRVMGYNEMSWKDWYSFISVQTDFVLVVSGKDARFNTYQDFVDYAAANPGKLSSGNPGLGSVGHLAAITFCNEFGVTTNHVPYAGGRAAAIGVMGGEIDYLFIAYGDVYDLIESGDMKPLACTGAADKKVTLKSGEEITIPALDAEHPAIGNTCSKLGMWGIAVPRTVEAEEVLAIQECWADAVNSQVFKDFCAKSGIKAVCISGEEADKIMAEGEAVYVALLESLDLTKVSGESVGIPAPADYSWDNVDLEGVNPWPNAQ